MRRFRTKNAPYISILSIGVDEGGVNPPVLALSCGVLTAEIRLRLGAIAYIHLTSFKSEFKIDALAQDGIYLGSLVRQQLQFTSHIHSGLQRGFEKNSQISVRLFSILNPDDYLIKKISCGVTNWTQDRIRRLMGRI